MIRKFVLAFLLLFFSSVSSASFQFYSDNDPAIAACQADVATFSSLVTNTSTTYYQYLCGFADPDNNFQFLNGTGSFTYALYLSVLTRHDSYSIWQSDSSPDLMSLYSFCKSPTVLNPAPSTYKGYSYSNSCVDKSNPNYKKWFKSKSLAASACSSDQYDSKFLALIADGSTNFLICPESSTDVKLKKGVDFSTAEIINEYSICEFPKKITDVPSGGYVNSCGDAPADGNKTSCSTGQILYKGNCYDVTNASTGGTGSTGTGSTGSTGTGDTGSTGTGSTGGDTGTGSTGTGSTGGDTGTGSTGTGSTGGDTSFTCADGSVIFPPLDCPKMYCGYINNQYACYDAVGNMGSTDTGSTGTGSTGTGTGDTGSTSTGGTGSTGTGSGGSLTCVDGHPVDSNSFCSGGTSPTGTGSTGTGSTGTNGTNGTNGKDVDSQGIIGAINGLKGNGIAKTVKTGDKGGFGTAADTALTKAQDDLNNKMAEVKSGLNSFKPDLSGGSGALPVFNFGQVRGVNLKFDLNDHSDSLSIVSSAVFFLASVMAFRIVLGG